MKNKKRTIIVISNPFGFGPTGKALAIMHQLQTSLSTTVEVVYATGDKCHEPLSERLRNKIKIEKINERDPNEISRILGKYNKPLVIVCLNRVAINTAKDLGVDAFFVDSLTWLWKEIPKDYLRADIYYAYDIFDAKEKVEGVENAKLIPPALGKLPKPQINKKDLILIHIGGFTNPLIPGFSREYLIMLANAINNFVDKKKSTKIIVTGGTEPLVFLKSYIKKGDNVLINTLPREKFLSILNKSSLFVTTSGLMATLEAFALKTFTVFLPPINLSQWKQLNLFAKTGSAPLRIEWEHYCSINWNFDLLDEREAIPKFIELAKFVFANKRAEFEEHVTEIFLTVNKNIVSQSKFIQKVGTNGAKVIAEDVKLFLKNRYS